MTIEAFLTYVFVADIISSVFLISAFCIGWKYKKNILRAVATFFENLENDKQEN